MAHNDKDTFGARTTVTAGGTQGTVYRIEKLEEDGIACHESSIEERCQCFDVCFSGHDCLFHIADRVSDCEFGVPQRVEQRCSCLLRISAGEQHEVNVGMS